MNGLILKGGVFVSTVITASHLFAHGFLYVENKVKDTAIELRDTYARSVLEKSGFSVVPMVDLDQHIEKESAKHSIDSNLVRALIFAESGFNTTAVSKTGAIGLMQILPSTAKLFGYGAEEMADPYKNITVGTKHLAEDLKATAWNVPKAIERYTCGPKNAGCAEGASHARNVLTIAASRGSRSWNSKRETLVALGKDASAKISS